MKLPGDTPIPQSKLTQYLLVVKRRNDKSKWLAQAGYTIENWQLLEADLRSQILSLEATVVENTQYGQMYEIYGNLTGPNGNTIATVTIWMTEVSTEITKFITMYPDKGRGQ